MRRSDDIQRLFRRRARDWIYSHARASDAPIPAQTLGPNSRPSLCLAPPGLRDVGFAQSVPTPQGWLRSREGNTNGADLLNLGGQLKGSRRISQSFSGAIRQCDSIARPPANEAEVELRLALELTDLLQNSQQFGRQALEGAEMHTVTIRSKLRPERGRLQCIRQASEYPQLTASKTTQWQPFFAPARSVSLFKMNRVFGRFPLAEIDGTSFWVAR